MLQADGSYYPVHDECGKQQRKLTDRERRKLLMMGHIVRYCDECQKIWLVAIGEEEKAALYEKPNGPWQGIL
jgi:hypothetical protein